MNEPVSSSLELPAQLQRYVVEQDYARYDAADQATWRFVLRHLVEHLATRAHPRTLEGVTRAGLSTERIPRIFEVDAALSAFGWRAVCVSGFVPPRVFQQFQARGILPIAAELRTPWHVAYTPAPDIIHEAAGHAPLLIDPVYAQYLKRVGELGELAFSCREDSRVHGAVSELSDLLERTSRGDPAVARARMDLAEALANQSHASEATRMARLYWWTAEYGLVGTPRDYKVYGAGLLSSLGEAVSCERPSVRKLPLTVACMDVPFDITRPQPQLFVVKEFERLFDVVGDARRELSAEQGVLPSLLAAKRSRLPAQVELSEGCSFTSVLREFGRWQGGAAWLEGKGPGRLTAPGGEWSGDTVLIPLGLPDPPYDPRTLATVQRSAGLLNLRYPHGVRVSGKLLEIVGDPRCPVLRLQDARVERAGATFSYRHYALPLFAQVRRAVPADRAFTSDVAAPNAPRFAPLARDLTQVDQEIRSLYERAAYATRAQEPLDAQATLSEIHDRLIERHPNEWLLRWNLLESLLRLGEGTHTAQLISELEGLERDTAQQQPIATGLRSLGHLMGQPDNDTHESMEDAS
jgi:phenylalanine-4-hydroxylase